MQHETATRPEGKGIDWKGVGYLVSMVSVLFLGAVAWPAPQAPNWELPALVAGMVTSILGMGFRYLSHRQQQREIEQAKAEAEASPR